MLTDTERTVLRRLAVFAGPFRLKSAQHVATDGSLDVWMALDAMAVLVERSLLQLDQRDPPRYRLLQTIRSYASELLALSGEGDDLVRRHGQAMAILALQLRDEYRRLDHQPFVELYVADYCDMQAAFDRACARRDAGVAAPTLAALNYLDNALGVFSQAKTRVASAYELLPAADDPLDRALLCRFLISGPGANPGVPRLALAHEHVDAWRKVGEVKGLYVALCELGTECAVAGDPEGANRALKEARGLEDQSWLPRLRSQREGSERQLSLRTGDVGAARINARKWLSLAEASGDATEALRLRAELVELATAADDFDESIALGQVVVDAGRRLNQSAWYGMSLAALCTAYLLSGNGEAARDAAARALPELRPNLLAGILFDHLAVLAVGEGDPENAARLLGLADQWYTTRQARRGPSTESRVMRLALSAIDAAIGELERTRLRAEGAALSDAQADSLAHRVLCGGAPSADMSHAS